MISYQWDAQERMLKLRDELKRDGYKVWMDVEEMGKSTTICSFFLALGHAMISYQ